MPPRAWRTAYASVVGTSHARSGAPCQDAGACRVVVAPDGSEVLVAAVSDGAGTATRSEAGSALAVTSFLDAFSAAASETDGLGGIDRDFALAWLDDVNAAIGRLADAEGSSPREYACTVLGAVLGPAGSVFLQVGDGAIVVGADGTGELSWVFWPQHGEFANQTNFVVQDDVGDVLEFERSKGRVDEVALFSDGIERLVLDIANQSVHSPAFRPIFDWLAATEPSAPEGPSGPLIAYLGSDRVNGRTDDDKTLVMATRAEPPGAAA